VQAVVEHLTKRLATVIIFLSILPLLPSLVLIVQVLVADDGGELLLIAFLMLIPAIPAFIGLIAAISIFRGKPSRGMVLAFLVTYGGEACASMLTVGHGLIISSELTWDIGNSIWLGVSCVIFAWCANRALVIYYAGGSR
jgi:hypothetical protein